MNDVIDRRIVPQQNADPRSVSQLIFVTVILAISALGGWYLYMADAPYHPKTTVTDASLISATD